VRLGRRIGGGAFWRCLSARRSGRRVGGGASGVWSRGTHSFHCFSDGVSLKSLECRMCRKSPWQISYSGWSSSRSVTLRIWRAYASDGWHLRAATRFRLPRLYYRTGVPVQAPCNGLSFGKRNDCCGMCSSGFPGSGQQKLKSGINGE